MLVGHFAAGFAAKRIAPRISLGTLVLAAMAADFLWTGFMLAGIEHVRFRPGIGAAPVATQEILQAFGPAGQGRAQSLAQGLAAEAFFLRSSRSRGPHGSDTP